jgi:hypothetical protein
VPQQWTVAACQQPDRDLALDQGCQLGDQPRRVEQAYQPEQCVEHRRIGLSDRESSEGAVPWRLRQLHVRRQLHDGARIDCQRQAKEGRRRRRNRDVRYHRKVDRGEQGFAGPIVEYLVPEHHPLSALRDDPQPEAINTWHRVGGGAPSVQRQARDGRRVVAVGLCMPADFNGQRMDCRRSIDKYPVLALIHGPFLRSRRVEQV